jgi:ligand-binding SRPBCC domain-containing protein
VFDLARSVDVHRASMAQTNERAIGGVTRGLMSLGDEVIWEARHFGLQQRLSVKITSLERPTWFQDVMVTGAFKRMIHDHEFTSAASGTLMVDRFDFESPFGILGWLVDRIVLRSYMRRLLHRRNKVLKNLAESDDWKEYVDV